MFLVKLFISYLNSIGLINLDSYRFYILGINSLLGFIYNVWFRCFQWPRVSFDCPVDNLTCYSEFSSAIITSWNYKTCNYLTALLPADPYIFLLVSVCSPILSLSKSTAFNWSLCNLVYFSIMLIQNRIIVIVQNSFVYYGVKLLKVWII